MYVPVRTCKYVLVKYSAFIFRFHSKSLVSPVGLDSML